MLFSCPQIGALVAPCVGPVLTEPVSGAVPSHLAGVLVAVAEHSRLIALLAGAHSYESNPYRLPFGKSASPSSTAMPFAVMRQRTSPSASIRLSIIPLRSSVRSTAISSSFVIFCHTALLVNLTVWSDQLARVVQALNLALGAAALLFSGRPTRGAQLFFKLPIVIGFLPRWCERRSQLTQVRRPPILTQCRAMDLRHFSAFELAPSFAHLFLLQRQREGEASGPRRGQRAASACPRDHAGDAACGAPRSADECRIASKAACGRGCEPGIPAVAGRRVRPASGLVDLDPGFAYGAYAAWPALACLHRMRR